MSVSCMFNDYDAASGVLRPTSEPDKQRRGVNGRCINYDRLTRFLGVGHFSLLLHGRA